jgi:hypothetical protein
MGFPRPSRDDIEKVLHRCKGDVNQATYIFIDRWDNAIERVNNILRQRGVDPPPRESVLSALARFQGDEQKAADWLAPPPRVDLVDMVNTILQQRRFGILPRDRVQQALDASHGSVEGAVALITAVPNDPRVFDVTKHELFEIMLFVPDGGAIRAALNRNKNNVEMAVDILVCKVLANRAEPSKPREAPPAPCDKHPRKPEGSGSAWCEERIRCALCR